jgi:transposase
MGIVTLGIDLGKSVCSVVGMDRRGEVVLRRRLRRNAVAGYVAKLPPCTVAMEACFGAHHLGRRFVAMGHEVRLLPPAYVRPYVKTQKNDDRDAEGIAEASSRPTMRTVPVKTVAQQDLQTLHRVRQSLVRRRTSVINQMRALALERGFVAARGPRRFAAELPEILSSGSDELSPRMRGLLEELRAEWRALDERIGAFDRELRTVARQAATTRRLMTVPGIGPLTATALTAAVGDASGLADGRALAAWLGLVPRQMTTGGRTRLVGIGKRGDRYVRTLLIHGARAALPSLAAKDTALGRWVRDLLRRHHRNVVVVALANKLARIAWAVMRRGTVFMAEGIGMRSAEA